MKGDERLLDDGAHQPVEEAGAVPGEVIAAHILARFGEPIEEASRPGIGESNQVWLTPTMVLRVSAHPGPNEYLAREASLLPHLPAEVGHPRLVASGAEADHLWVLTERLRGRNLSQAWSELSLAQRLASVEDLWNRLAALQGTDTVLVRSLGALTCPMYALQLSEAQVLVDGLVEAGLVDSELHRRLDPVLADLFSLMAQVPWRLNHTDPGTHNAVFDGHDAIPVDFEFAALAPCDLDLDGMLVHLHHAEDRPVVDHLLGLTEEHVERPGGRRRLTGYRILRRLWASRLWQDYALARDRDRPQGSWPPRDKARWEPLVDLAGLVASYESGEPR